MCCPGKTPEEGGATVFPNADVKIQPKPNGALFFAYKGDDGYMDHGKTEHAGCVISKGAKQIATVWMREGLSRNEPWASYYNKGVT